MEVKNGFGDKPERAIQSVGEKKIALSMDFPEKEPMWIFWESTNLRN